MTFSLILSLFLLFFFLFESSLSMAVVWKVGPSRTYTLPSQVSGLVSDGDVVEIDAAIYLDCATWNANNLILMGVGGKPQIKNKVCERKGIWNLNGKNTTIENIEFSGATNIDQNGAGIRGVGGGFTVRNCFFHNNDNGILASPEGVLTSEESTVLIEYSEFYQNGFGDGQSHNLYMGNFQNFTLQYCFVHAAKVGHEVKSRAHNNYILYNRIADEGSDASRNIDLPNGGNSIIIGNIIEQGPNSANSNMVGYGLEGLANPAPHHLYIINNTFVNNKTNSGNFVMVQSGTELVKIVNTIFAGTGTVVSGTPGTLDSAKNLVRASISAVRFKDPVNFNYELTPASPAIDKGINPGIAGSFSLSPIAEYMHPTSKKDRVSNNLLDNGSIEYHPVPLAIFSDQSQEKLNSVYPNPFMQSCTLHLATNALKIIVTDLFGKELMHSLPPTHSDAIEIGEGLPGGTFVVMVYYSTGRTEMQKITKIK